MRLINFQMLMTLSEIEEFLWWVWVVAKASLWIQRSKLLKEVKHSKDRNENKLWTAISFNYWDESSNNLIKQSNPFRNQMLFEEKY